MSKRPKRGRGRPKRSDKSHSSNDAEVAISEIKQELPDDELKDIQGSSEIEEQPTKKYSLRKSRQLNIPPEAFESDSDKEEHVETIINDEVTVETVETCHEQENFVDPIAYEDSAFVDVSNRQVKIEPSTADDDAVDGIKQELLDSAQPKHVEEEAIPEALSDALQESIEDLMMGSMEAAFPGASALEKSLDEILAQQRAHEASMADQDS